MNGQVEEAQGRPLPFETVDGGLPPMRAAVVDYPEHSLGAGVGFDGHHLFDQATEGDDPGGVFAAGEHSGLMHVVGSHVGHRCYALVLML